MRRVILLILALTLLAAVPALAGDYPDLKGQWTSTGKAVVHGTLPHHQDVAKPQFVSGKEFTLRIDQQEEGRFSGERSSAKHKEMILGLIDEDGKVSMVDDDGMFFGTYDKATGTMKLTYMEAGKGSKVVAQGVYTRVKK
ncbi:MAG TPA: hypothetical protein DDW80_01645 [Desulfovibrio sp.]|nr:hypothetical protein [Desulfovibrio sp.]